MIEVQDIKKSFEGVEVLKGISATFHQGKTNLIIGQSGSGKTVFLKTLLGLHVPDSGNIIYAGVKYAEMSKEQRRKLRQEMGMVFQGSAPTMSGAHPLPLPILIPTILAVKSPKIFFSPFSKEDEYWQTIWRFET